MTTIIAAGIVIVVVALFALTYGRVAARRAERYVGAWAWLVYGGLGAGMIFGAMSIQHPLLSAFMWTKLSAFILTGAWLAQGRVRRHERLFPGAGGASHAAAE